MLAEAALSGWALMFCPVASSRRVSSLKEAQILVEFLDLPFFCIAGIAGDLGRQQSVIDVAKHPPILERAVV